MNKLFTKEQARKFLKENNLKNADSIGDALAAQFKDLLQEALEAEMDHELGYSKYDWKNKEDSNSRNGHTKKTIKSRFGEMEISTPRDTNGEFEPVAVKKHERVLSTSVEDMIISMYAKGMSTRDIHAHMHKIYGVNISADLVSGITDKVLPVAREWQNRPLPELYAIVYLDGMVFSVNQEGQVAKKTAYVITGITIEGERDVLGIWIGEAESAKFWMSALVSIKNRGVKDILIASIDGLSGFEQAIESVFPQTEIQRCIVHQIRNSCKFVGWKDRKAFCGDMKLIYTAPNEEAGLEALDKFDGIWGKKFPYAIKGWRSNWKSLSTFFKYPDEIRKIIDTTNPIEGFNRVVRKATKNKSSFPTDDALFKMLYLVVIDSYEKRQTIRDWNQMMNQLGIYFGERVTNRL